MAAPTAPENPNLDLGKTASPYQINSHLVDNPEKQPPSTSPSHPLDSKDQSKTDRGLDQSNRASTDTDLDLEKAGAEKASDGEGLEGVGPQTESEAEPEYPSNKKLIPIIGSLYFSFFLVALVRPSWSPFRQPLLIQSPGPYHPRHCHPSHHRRIPLFG